MFEDNQTMAELNNNPDEQVKDEIWNHDSQMKALKFDPQTGKLKHSCSAPELACDPQTGKLKHFSSAPQLALNPQTGKPRCTCAKTAIILLLLLILFVLSLLLIINNITLSPSSSIRSLNEGFDHLHHTAGLLDVRREKDCMVLAAKTEDEIKVCSLHILGESDIYQPGHSYGGIIIYQYNGKSKWKTANGVSCWSACIVIQDTDSEDVKKWMSKEPGVVHGAIYRNAFGESVNDAEVVGEGFAIQNGISNVEEFKNNSGVFNNPKGSKYHDHRRSMHELSEHCVRKIVNYWKRSPLSSRKVYSIKNCS